MHACAACGDRAARPNCTVEYLKSRKPEREERPHRPIGWCMAGLSLDVACKSNPDSDGDQYDNWRQTQPRWQDQCGRFGQFGGQDQGIPPLS